jgi:hypothetical protein
MWYVNVCKDRRLLMFIVFKNQIKRERMKKVLCLVYLDPRISRAKGKVTLEKPFFAK